MQNDMFKTKKEQMLDFIKEKHYVRTSETIKFASSIYSNRGDRDCRQLAEEGHIERLSKQDKIRMFGVTKEEIWRFIK